MQKVMVMEEFQKQKQLIRVLEEISTFEECEDCLLRSFILSVRPT